MIFHPVIFMLLCWQCTGGKSLENFSVKSVLDQVTIPTKIFNDFFQRSERNSPSRKLVSNERIESSTVHYGNSNGFLPLVVSTQPYDLKDIRNFTYSGEKINETISKRHGVADKDYMHSTEDKMLSNFSNVNENRRSYYSSGNQDDFEPLKVGNGTPIIANYDTLYDQSKENSKPEPSYYTGNFKKSIRNKDRERGKKIQSYLGNYDGMNEDDQYNYGDITVDEKKNTFQQEKSHDRYKSNNAENYKPNNAEIYKPNNAETYNPKPSLPRTNYATMSTPKPTPKQTSNSGNNEYKFQKPIMVEPSEYKVDVKLSGQTSQTAVSTSRPQVDTKDQVNPVYSEYEIADKFSQAEGINRNYDSADSRDFSDEYDDDYVDEKEKSQRLLKTKRRPHHFDSSRKLPKEHRETYENSYDDKERKRANLRSKSRYRPQSKPVRVVSEYQYNNEGSSEENSNDSNKQNNQQNGGNSWNQVTPNLEVSHSNGFEVDQIEKPKLRIVPFNAVPTFDHATALDNSQGFDITNAMFTGFVDGSLVSTAAPLVSSTSNYLNENMVSSSTIQPKIELSTPVPDVIVGQSSFNNPVHAVLMPNKMQQNMLNHYIQSTVSPAVFAVTPQSGFSASPTITSQLQQILNQMQVFPVNQLMTAQPTHQSIEHTYDSNQSNPSNLNSNYNDNQKPYKPTYQSTSRSTTERTDSHHKKKTKGNNNQYLSASASMSVEQGTYRQSNNRNNKKKHNNHNDDTNNNVENVQQTPTQNLNTYVQPTLVPAILHTGYGLLNNQNPLILTNSQQTQLFKATNDALENSIKQLQYNILKNRNQFSQLDSIGGASNNINTVNKAQLPILGAKNVEIINPNLNPNSYAINQIPTAIVTTPIPIFTTTGFITSKPAVSSTTQEAPVSVSNFVNALTESGTKKPDYKNKNNPFLNLQGPDRPFFNPINFVPNYDLVKSQSILNYNAVPHNQFSQQNLNLVPIVPGGNFYKHSQGAQVDLANKPKLSSDLEKYAEEMFKESLRTIYNSHKWNNDARAPATNNISLVDDSDIGKLRNELLRIKNTLRESKLPKDVLEAHQTENKIRAVKPGHDHKRPDSSIEQSHKHKHHSSGPHHHSHHHHRSKPQINDFLTPPKANSFVSQSPFYDKPPKKRPPHGPRPNFNHENSRPRPRQGVASTKIKGSDTQGSSSITDYRLPGPQSYSEKYHYNQPDYRSSQNFNYPTFTTAYPDIDQYKSSGEYKLPNRDILNINHQRTHNLMGLLMKNTQLPPGMQSKQFNNKDTISQYFDEENKRTQSQAYEDALRSFQKKSDRQARPIPLSRITNVAYPKTTKK